MEFFVGVGLIAPLISLLRDIAIIIVAIKIAQYLNTYKNNSKF